MQRISRFLFVLIFYSSYLFAQNKQDEKNKQYDQNKLQEQNKLIDSLTNLLKTDKDDTAKVNHLNKLGILCKSIPGRDTSYALQAIELAKKLNYKNGIAYGYCDLAVHNWLYTKNNIKAIEYYLKAEAIYQQTGALSNLRYVYLALGTVYSGMDSFTTSLKYEFQALKVDKKSNYIRTNTLNNIGDNYKSLGDYPNALKYDMEALKNIKNSDRKKVALTLENIGELYTIIGDYKNAILYLDSALNTNREIRYSGGQKMGLVDLAMTYKSEKEYAKALDYAFQALKLSNETNSLLDMANTSEVIGEIYKETGDYEKALKYEEDALKISEEIKYIPFIIKSRGAIGEIYLKQKNYKEAEKCLLVNVAAAQGSHELKEQEDYELDLSQLYSATGQYKKSLDHYTRYVSFKDSLFNQNTSRQIGKIEASEEYNKQLATQQAEEDNAKAIADAKSKRQKIISLVTALIAIIIALIAFIIYRSLRTAKREKIMVEKEKILLELKALRAQMNPHFIFNAINSIQNFILGNDLDAAQKHLSRFSKLMRMVLENSSYENIPLADEIKMLELYLEFETVRFSSRFHYKIIVDASIDKNNTFISPLIMQPYVENAIWHGLMHLKDRQGEVTIHFEALPNQLKCTIDDNGIGRAKSMELKKNNIHKSMGLSIASERIEIINTLFKSKMHINFTDKLNGGGTTVELLMPMILNT